MLAGILNVNKPPGMASFAVVSLVRRLTGVKRVGHAGTLDPIADGVLPICIGPATRIVEYIVNEPKTYRVAMKLGAATDTYDREGSVVATGDATRVTREQIESALAGFVGEIEQLAPMYSALKHKGQPLYRYARAGKTVPRKPRTVSVYDIHLHSFEPPMAEVEMRVGRGVYVRTVVHDLGERLRCYAYVERLSRLQSGPFTIDEASTPADLSGAAERNALDELMYPIDRVLEHWYAALLGEQHTLDVSSGREVVLQATRPELSRLAPDTPCRAYSSAGEFLAILRYQGGDRWHPDTVFTAR